MTPDEIREKLAQHSEVLREFHVKSLSLFGSFARGEAGEGSDVDLLVTFDDIPSLFQLVRAQDRLSALLDRKVDLVTEGALNERVRARMAAELVRLVG